MAVEPVKPGIIIYVPSVKPGFPPNMSPLGSDPALWESLTFTVTVNEDEFGL